MKKGILIGITGASGSGKTLVTRNIFENLGSQRVVIIQEDSYYKDLSDVPYEDRVGRNFDHPDAFDHDLLIKHISQLLDGAVIPYPIYDYKLHTRSKKTKTVGQAALIILEGILILHLSELRDLLDLKIYVDVPLDICLSRRLRRDIEERGRSLGSVLSQYHETVRPMFFEFIDASKDHVDIIVPRGGENLSALNVLHNHLDRVLALGK